MVGMRVIMEPTTQHEMTSETLNARLPTVERGFAFHFAAEYFDRGWSVLPLNAKRPAVSSWRKYQKQRAGLDQLRTWFRVGERNVGIITGPVSGLVVVDCDTAADALFWKQQFPQSPLVVRTGGGGCHHYYRYPDAEQISNRTGLLARRIDLRAEGGYVVALPLRHPNGDHYRWQGTTDYSLDDVPYFSPDWIAEKSSPRPTAPTGRIRSPRS